MSTGVIIVLGAFAGLTIFLGLPLAFLRNLPPTLKMFLSMLATGVLLFLLYDVLAKSSEPIGEAITEFRKGTGSGATLTMDIALLVAGLVIGLLGLVYFKQWLVARARRRKPLTGDGLGGDGLLLSAANAGQQMVLAQTGELSARGVALIIAAGIGLHNFSEGLAIGQSAASGELALATVLIVGFGLHNMTEGFGIAGPLPGQTVTWRFVALLGLIGGGPTFLGTILGITFHSPALFIFCLALAAGAIVYVLAEMFGHAKRAKAQDIVMWGLLVGFLLGYMTDLIVSFAGA